MFCADTENEERVAKRRKRKELFIQIGCGSKILLKSESLTGIKREGSPPESVAKKTISDLAGFFPNSGKPN
jgi:hypothetical protein